ncbi:MAG: type II secretion system protein [Bacilli bacterium]|nr:type II secretion system protein [Bacilli bacterium]
MKNGFTLAELLGVIVILGIIAVITTTTVGKSLRNSHYETCLTQEKNIIEGVKSWAIDHAKDLPNAGETISISLSELQDNGYVEDELKNPMTSEGYSAETKVDIYSSNGTSYEYNVIYGSDNEKCLK